MPRETAHGQRPEPWLERILATLRYRPTLRRLHRLRTSGRLRGLDYGCGYHGRFVQLANELPEVEFRGCDLAVDSRRPELLSSAARPLLQALAPLDVITLHAVLEHLDDPRGTVEFLRGLLGPRGCLILTVPSRRAQPVLEFLAYRLGVISRVEIEDHKRYYDRESLMVLLGDLFPNIEHRYFQAGMNNRVVACLAGSP